jgi:hypothetical protein
MKQSVAFGIVDDGQTHEQRVAITQPASVQAVARSNCADQAMTRRMKNLLG